MISHDKTRVIEDVSDLIGLPKLTFAVGYADYTGTSPDERRHKPLTFTSLRAVGDWLNTWSHPTADKTNRGDWWCPFPERKAGTRPDWAALVLDCDHQEPPDALKQYEHVVYETRSSKPDDRSWRIIVRITEPLPQRVARRVAQSFGTDVKAAVKTQLFWGRHPERKASYHAGRALDWRELELPEDDSNDSSTVAQRVADIESSDPRLRAIVDAGLALEQPRPDGKMNIDCPFGDEHESGTNNPGGCVYLLPHFNGMPVGVIHCFHASCEGRSQAEYDEKIGYDPHPVSDQFDAVRLPVKVAVPDSLTPAMRRTKSGRFLGTLENVLAVLRSGVAAFDVRHDAFRDELMLAPRGTDEWRAATDADVTAIQESFERARFNPIGREVMRHALDLIGAEQQFDSAVHWLDGLSWDGARRVDAFLSVYFGAEDSEYPRAVSRYLWTALAGRVLEPGCQVDMVPILVGGQGLLKSSALAAMVPAPEHFAGFGFQKIDHPDTSRRMRGVLLGEIAELKGINSRDIESIKDWITRRYERWTPKYKEFDTVFPRRVVFVGTTNDDEFLADETGNRRWLPVEVGLADREAIAADRDQLWAEAREIFRKSGVAWRDAERLAPDVHGDYMVSDSWEEAVAEWLAQPVDSDVPFADTAGQPLRSQRPFTMGTVLGGALNIEKAQRSKPVEMRAARVLQRLGYKRSRVWINGKRVRGWEAQRESVDDLV